MAEAVALRFASLSLNGFLSFLVNSGDGFFVPTVFSFLHTLSLYNSTTQLSKESFNSRQYNHTYTHSFVTVIKLSILSLQLISIQVMPEQSRRRNRAGGGVLTNLKRATNPNIQNSHPLRIVYKYSSSNPKGFERACLQFCWMLEP
jgi:hypothetical protein